MKYKLNSPMMPTAKKLGAIIMCSTVIAALFINASTAKAFQSMGDIDDGSFDSADFMQSAGSVDSLQSGAAGMQLNGGIDAGLIAGDEPEESAVKGSTMSIKEDRDSSVNLSNKNLSVEPAIDISGSISVEGGTVTLKSGNTVSGNITVAGGDLILGANTEVGGNIKVSGNIKIGHDSEIKGSISVGSLSAGDNVNISGPVSVTSSGKNITVGSNSDINNTLTSKAGLVIGHNSDVKLFLSGDSIEIDGKMYKLGGKVISKGMVTSVGMPFVPKTKNADGSKGKITTNTPATSENMKEPETEKATSEATKKPEVNKEVDGANIENNESDSSAIDEMELPDIEDIINTEDVDAYVQEVSSSDENVSDLALSSESVNMDYKMPARLFGFIPVSIKTNVNVTKDKKVDVAFPWYSFLFSKPADEKAIENNISNSIKNSVGQNEGELSVKLQAFISNSILSTLRGLFGGN